MNEWFILVYKIPVEPTRYRASIWRKLKAAGAVYLQNGVAALPSDTAGERVMRGVVHDIGGMQGTAYLIRGTPLGDENGILASFTATRDAEYRELLGRCRAVHAELTKERAIANFTFAELEENEEDVSKLETWLGKIRNRDPFGAPLRAEAEQAFAACRADLEDFAASVYRAADHGSAASSEPTEAGGEPPRPTPFSTSGP